MKTVDEQYPNGLPVGIYIVVKPGINDGEQTLLVGNVNDLGGTCNDCNINKWIFVREVKT